ncbi:MAG: DUF998 domain-containing protein [Anaerolineaceae bacterium]|nr:DUF998 domain-containing protein [Anaerolineaceae bacterium]
MKYIESRKLENWFGLFGVMGFITYLLAVFISPRAYPGYDWMGQAISDLSALSAPSRELWMQIVFVSSACGLSFALLTCLYAQNRLNKTLRTGIYLFAILSWVDTIGYTLFPLTESGYAGTLQDVVHVFIVTFAVLALSITMFILFIIGGFRSKQYQSIAIIAAICLCGLIIGTVGMVVAPLGYGGLMERICIFSSQGFSLVLGLYVFIGFDLIEGNLSQR